MLLYNITIAILSSKSRCSSCLDEYISQLISQSLVCCRCTSTQFQFSTTGDMYTFIVFFLCIPCFYGSTYFYKEIKFRFIMYSIYEISRYLISFTQNKHILQKAKQSVQNDLEHLPHILMHLSHNCSSHLTQSFIGKHFTQ